jgi:transposase
MSETRDQDVARLRASVILAVRSGQITAEEGARRLGISRKTYYEWENRALQALTEALEDRDPGRPAAPHDEEKEQLQKENVQLKNELFLAKKTEEVRNMLHLYELQRAKEKKAQEKKQKKKGKR